MGARVGCGRSYPAGEEPNGTGPWVATSEGVAIQMSARWGQAAVLEWLKLHFPEALLIRVVDDDMSELVWRFKGPGEMMHEFLDRVTRVTYGRSRAESIRDRICVQCGKEITQLTKEHLAEYRISGLCEDCQLKVFGRE
jgi:hypothetical protein